MQPRLDEQDIKILKLLQENCKLSSREIAKKLKSSTTTVFSKIKRMEKQGVVRGYKAVLNAKALDNATTAFILASFTYRNATSDTSFSQRDIAKQIANLPEVQEVHIITGDWDILIKAKTQDVDSVGRFVIDKLRLVKGIEKTLTCMVFDTIKETTEIHLGKPPSHT